MITLHDISLGIGAQPPQTVALDRVVHHFEIDSRQVERDDVFIALPGERADGHDYVSQALARGALVAIVRKDRAVMAPEEKLIRVDDVLTALQKLGAYWRAKFPTPPLRVIAVTGSIGKTTTKELAAQILALRFNTLKNEGNLNNEIGVPLTLLNLRPYHERAVIEMGMYLRGEIASYCQWARPHVGVLTMIGPVHLERLGTMENIALAKRELIDALPAAADGGIAILNNDDPRVMEMAAHTRARIITYGLTSAADVWADDIESHGLDGISFRLHHGDGAWMVHAPLLGQHSAQTALRAAAVGWGEGMNWEDIVEGLSQRTDQLRLSVLDGPHHSIVLDDSYNASPESTMAALNLLAQLSDGPRVAVLGDMLELGEDEEKAHREIGCRAGIVAAYLVCVGPRAKWIAEEAIACGAKKSNVVCVTNNAEALDALKRIIREKSVILIKGSRGMVMEEIVQGLTGVQSAHFGHKG
ncbi:MAG TPA: UDP-N-acetylmuramoyl-tripeptide--D-alanyl-D-alanine ligase [Thermoflexales bacterium]|nr:UDP-N-acetylmuramoyl-tripeptide--D-alanyl-D-alanine ligase [Thermoflexales bacterium]HQW35236.1 UDP-N-acetylmuramoyl-tripeptide--D-alanyl-D-alanine ligase [Thermoflexales bacterium]HQZ20896.1 UDP-N-acetylmuramoyl-tripeptide--D-alanyl-D-alanine ligase [Thermoflexales bacterium]HQZ98867.1 UDP-N-acetylmuramoyl-tripeptide--D-alanyl-D-alanine ligase [Thermoflexales bacterium]